ncbi:MAG: hypothetical protein ABR570_05295 [Burkholderiales bacterium]
MAKENKALGAELVIPVLGAAFAAYFFFSTAELVWEAKANGVVIGVALVALIALQAARTLIAWRRGEGKLGFESLVEPRELLGRRVALVALTAAFIALLPWLGLTLALWLGMLAALLILGVRSRAVLFWLPLGTAASVYALFIALLDTEFPRGPIEALLARLLA